MGSFKYTIYTPPTPHPVSLFYIGLDFNYFEHEKVIFILYYFLVKYGSNNFWVEHCG